MFITHIVCDILKIQLHALIRRGYYAEIKKIT
nr:MAG TPA: hypothetical protein [Caudoviricetes sp.]